MQITIFEIKLLSTGKSILFEIHRDSMKIRQISYHFGDCQGKSRFENAEIVLYFFPPLYWKNELIFTNTG